MQTPWQDQTFSKLQRIKSAKYSTSLFLFCMNSNHLIPQIQRSAEFDTDKSEHVPGRLEPDTEKEPSI